MLKLLSGHWRGEYPLGRAFWLHGIVTWILINVLAAGLAVANPDDGSATAKGMRALSLIVLLLPIWLFVGIWRSAQNEKKLGKMAGPLLAQGWILAFLVIEVLFTALFYFEPPDL